MIEKVTRKSEPTSKEQISAMRKYLSGYSVFRNIWESSLNDANHFGNPINAAQFDGDPSPKNDLAAEARVKMFEIRRFVTSLPGSDEKLFLFLRYIHGETAESCAAKMHISPRQSYRLQQMALLMAYKEKEKQENGKNVCIE